MQLVELGDLGARRRRLLDGVELAPARTCAASKCSCAVARCFATRLNRASSGPPVSSVSWRRPSPAPASTARPSAASCGPEASGLRLGPPPRPASPDFALRRLAPVAGATGRLLRAAASDPSAAKRNHPPAMSDRPPATIAIVEAGLALLRRRRLARRARAPRSRVAGGGRGPVASLGARRGRAAASRPRRRPGAGSRDRHLRRRKRRR